MTDKEKQTEGNSDQNRKCSFCGKPEKDVKKMVTVGANQKPICNECIVTCSQILKDTL